ncbi:serine protease [Phycomyces nitens]|nr:serine protease [Phycomyces nitens]
MKITLLTAALLLSGYCTAVPFIQPIRFSEGKLAPLYTSDDAETLGGQYIVALKPHLHPQQIEKHNTWIQAKVSQDTAWIDHRVRIDHLYDTQNFKGYSGKFSDAVLQQIRQSNDVSFVEKDSRVYATELQRNAPWGLARISHRRPLDLRSYNKYDYQTEGGKDVKVYVIDTGINTEHVDFEGRATWGKTMATGDEDVDGNGHGSHCAGTIGGKRYGVAKQSLPVAVKVLRSNGSGSMADVIAGVDWAVQQHQKDASEAEAAGKPYKGSVANMSLGGGKSRGLDMVVDGAVEAGMVFVVAAGNDNRDACDYSPARSELAITVGASNIKDERAYFSNFGSCVDVFAPGMNILSVWKGSKYATNTISGTSMASPHVAGLSAYILSVTDKVLTPKQVKDMIIELSSRDVLTKVPSDTPNLLVFNGI